MSDFERDIVHCMNNFLGNAGIAGFAYRLKQAKFNAQYVDVLVDSLDPRYYLAIECKSIRGKKLYFTQHFHQDKNNTHQVESIAEFVRKTGRRGFLAVEFRAGSGRAKEAYLMPWDEVIARFRSDAGISLEAFRASVPLERNGDTYILPALYPKNIS